MWQQCGDMAVLLLSFGLLLLGRGQHNLEKEGVLNEKVDLMMEVEGNDSVEEGEKEEMVGQDELEDLHLEVGRRLLVKGGLQVTLLRPGRRCRRKVVNGDLVAIQYEGRLEGEEWSVFHSTELRQPFVFVVESGRALPGLVAGVRGMCRGEVRSLYLPMELAWGEQPPPPLPANASVHYKVELEMIQEGVLLPIPTPLAPAPVDEACYMRGDNLDCRGLP